jgi:hypothetical protein
VIASFGSRDVAAWAAAATAVVTAVSVAVGVFGYFGKARAQEAEANVRLLEAFASLIPIADGRITSHLSETAVAKILASVEGQVPSGDAFRNLLRPAVIPEAPGLVTQAAAVAAISELGRRHKVIREPATWAIRGLEYLDAGDSVLGRSYRDAKARLDP